jgi:transposase
MSKLAEVVPHLTVAELQRRFRECDDAVEKIHWQAVWLRAQGRSTSEVAEICGYNRDWVHRLVRRYNAGGADCLQDGRRDNGKPKLMSDAQLEELRQAVLAGSPPGGGLWTGPKVAAWMTNKLGRPVSPQLAWDYLQHIGFSKQTPRPRHARASARAQEAWKKNSAAG